MSRNPWLGEMESNHQLREQTHLQWVSLPLGYRSLGTIYIALILLS